MHKYVVLLWDEDPNSEEIVVVCEADSWFDAEKIFKDFNVPGYIKGGHFYADGSEYLQDAIHISEFNKGK